MTVRLAGESDAFEDRLPVAVLAAPEVGGRHGQAQPGRGGDPGDPRRRRA